MYKKFLNKKNRFTFCLLPLLSSTACLNTAMASGIDNSHQSHEEAGFELGLSVGYAYLKEEKENGTVIHAHLMKRLSGDGLQKYFSVGLGAETILADDKHYGAMATLAVHPWAGLTLSVSPGVEWKQHDGETESAYATHIEANYVFETPHFHIGPVIGYSKTHEDEHYKVGIHLGIPL